ncbi:hypothetical protein F511_39789 [Dorcoceras hygrometricum]|uniref:Glycosyltransferase n=1 Tax=Dorcoceras hygrometricum TaxID=472368 RepID=A0A2Z7A7N2_9LAMI|nr:hypothetical protein F511_39789 [Dorcoceras hygrometricum]
MEDAKMITRLDYAIYLLLLMGLSYILISQVSNEEHMLMLKKPTINMTHDSKMGNILVDKDELDKILSSTSTTKKTLIITIINKAYVEGDKPMLDLFLDGFWMGENTRNLIDHLLIVAMDQTSYERCRFLRLHCYKLETEGVDFVGEKLYMSKDFIKMMWRRTYFLMDVLARGYSFIFTDTDVLWLRDPFPLLNPDRLPDLQISTDVFNGDRFSENNRINTGFYMVRSNNRTIALFESWYSQKDEFPKLKEQDILQNLIRGGISRKIGLKIHFLDTVYFSGFCQNSRNVSAVSTVHANCCRHIAAKLADLTAVVHDWRRFKANETTSTFSWSDHVACYASWRQ